MDVIPPSHPSSPRLVGGLALLQAWSVRELWLGGGLGRPVAVQGLRLRKLLAVPSPPTLVCPGLGDAFQQGLSCTFLIGSFL